MRPSKVQPTLLSASHSPQGGDDLDCSVKSVWSLKILPKPCVGRGGCGRGSTVWGQIMCASVALEASVSLVQNGLPVRFSRGGTMHTAMD